MGTVRVTSIITLVSSRLFHYSFSSLELGLFILIRKVEIVPRVLWHCQMAIQCGTHVPFSGPVSVDEGWQKQLLFIEIQLI